MAKMRESTGGGYEKRGAFFIRVTVGPQKRQAEHAPWARSLDETIERGRVAQVLVNRLRRAGQTDFVEKFVEQAAKAAPEDMQILERKVAALEGVEGVDFQRVKPAPKAKPLSTQTDVWLASVVSLYRPTTHATLTQYASRWPDMFPDGITAQTLARWMPVRLGQVTAKTVKKELCYLRAFLKWSVDVAGTLDAVPAFPRLPKRATGVRVGPQREKPVQLTEEQIVRLLAELSARARPRYTFMAETGLRPETIDQLRCPEHYTVGSPTIEITDAIDKAAYGRALPLSAGAREVLDGLLTGRTKPGPIFGPRLPKEFKKAVDAAGLPKETAPYDLRHAKATHGLEASGGDLAGVAYLLGHKQVTTTNRYVHGSQRSAAAVLDALDCRREDGGKRGGKESSGGGGTDEKPKGIKGGDRRGSNPRHLEPQSSDGVASRTIAGESAQDLAEAVPGIVEDPARHEAVPPRRAAASSEVERLKATIAELQAKLADARRAG